MNKMHFTKKITSKELDSFEGKTLKEKIRKPAHDLLMKVYEAEADGDWYLYGRWPNGVEGDLIITLQNTKMSEKTLAHMNFNLISKYYLG